MRVIIGVASLIATSVLWGSSFPAIKVVVTDVGGSNYVWMRAAVVVMALLPLLVFDVVKGRLSAVSVKGGLLAGIAYGLGLWLQGVGTGITTPSNAAFITGLNVVIVHLYTALILRNYNTWLMSSLALSVAGLWALTTPSGGPNLGDILVFVSSFFWAAQVIIVSKYSSSNPLHFTFFQTAPSILFIAPSALANGLPSTELKPTTIALIIYLGIACTLVAFALQVYGQRFVSPAVAATIFLLEPPAAAIISWATLGDAMTGLQIVGAALILASMYLAVKSEIESNSTKVATRWLEQRSNTQHATLWFITTGPAENPAIRN